MHVWQEEQDTHLKRICVVEWDWSVDRYITARTEPAVLTLGDGSCQWLLADWLHAADEIQLFKHSQHL